MTIEAAIAGLTEAMNKNTETGLALIAALKVTGENQERLIAGQAAAIEKVEAPKQTRTRAKKDEQAPVAEKPESQEEPLQDTPTVTVSDDDLRQVAGDFLKGDGKLTAEQVTERRDFVASVMAELGTKKLCGPESTLDADGRKKASFFIKRKGEGLKVDFGADYDFDGDVTQGGEPEASAEDDLGI